MQMLVEGLAMGAFANGYRNNRDPLAKQLFQLVMTDEAFHHKFGKIWADRTVPELSQAERNMVEDWAAHCAQSLLFNRGSPAQQRGDVRGLRPRSGAGDRRHRQAQRRARPEPALQRRDQHLPGADQDPASTPA